MGILTIDEQFSSMLVPLIRVQSAIREKDHTTNRKPFCRFSQYQIVCAHAEFSVLRIRSNIRDAMSQSDSVHVKGAYKILRVSATFNSINLMLDVFASFFFSLSPMY